MECILKFKGEITKQNETASDKQFKASLPIKPRFAYGLCKWGTASIMKYR